MNSARRIPTFLGAWHGVWSLTWRRRLAWREFPRLAAQVLVLPLLALFTISAGEDKPFWHWVVHFYLLLIVPLSCLLTFGGMFREELQADTLGFLTSRPLTRARLYLAYYGAHWGWLQALTSLNLLLLLGVGWFREVPGVWGIMGLVWGVQILSVTAYGALSALLGLIHTRFMVLGILYGFVVEIGIGRIPTNIHSLALSYHFTSLLAQSTVLKELYDWVPDKTWLSVMTPLLATTIFLAAGALFFTVREFLQSQEVQK